ncbi:MAG: hypothetical protein A2Z11_03290 [Candidatus Woykebacteria bacterium RBG_16_43_9]|uniref:Glycosyl transferase family 1 domain-containing protein n=1 Tax=Candidatus Woykebacteria bacterium RBG_16_43_9 TaxID=1802596 RepID=A0A1G1WE18_9BACT|nr:MAG: hypothetical protein A2Z11_03290 [Candidatus Woykebacteria bacterium RBG_16_43_9]
MIIFISSSPFMGGAEYQMLDLIRGLAGKYEIRLLSNSSSPLQSLLPKDVDKQLFDLGNTLGKFRGINVLDPKNLVRIRNLGKVFSSLGMQEKDLVVTYDYKELIFAKSVKGKSKHIHFQHPQFPNWLRLNPFVRSLVVSSMNEVDKIVTDCFAVKAHLKQFGVKEDKMEVIYNGIDESKFVPAALPEKNKIRKGLGLVGKQIIGINARVNAGKGYETLISAFKQTKTGFPDTHLISVGGGNPYIQKKISTLVNKLGLSGRVKFLGEWPRDKTAEFYKAIDIFTLPSETEGLPLTVIEAMFSGLPVVATSVGGIPEEVVDDQTGLLVPAKDPNQLAEAFRKLLKDKSRGQKMGEAGREIALRKFTKKKMIDNTYKLLVRMGVRQ